MALERLFPGVDGANRPHELDMFKDYRKAHRDCPWENKKQQRTGYQLAVIRIARNRGRVNHPS